MSQRQYGELKRVANILESKGYSVGKIHLLASYGIIDYPELGGDIARPGIAMCGVLSNRADMEKCPITIRPVLALKARIAVIKKVKAGEGVGYGYAYVADSERQIGVLSIGYADGIPRMLSCGKGQVLIHGKAAPIVGNICMDQMMVDVSDIPETVSGDIAVLIGKSGDLEISAYGIAEQCGTITNEVLSRLGKRLKRIVV